jgi:hypothetical protein
MKPRKAAHFSVDVGGSGVPLATGLPGELAGLFSCAIFFANLSRSSRSIRSLRFNAPGRLFMLFRLMIFTWSTTPFPAEFEARRVLSSFSSSGRAETSASRVVTSFLFGRRRRLALDCVEDLVIFEINAACLICRLSFLVDGKSCVDEAGVGRKVEDFFKIDFLGLGGDCMGA